MFPLWFPMKPMKLGKQRTPLRRHPAPAHGAEPPPRPTRPVSWDQAGRSQVARNCSNTSSRKTAIGPIALQGISLLYDKERSGRSPLNGKSSFKGKSRPGCRKTRRIIKLAKAPKNDKRCETDNRCNFVDFCKLPLVPVGLHVFFCGRRGPNN